ncbi:MAG TPA: methyltransferase domain-containing protein [Pirellulales bacterium]
MSGSDETRRRRIEREFGVPIAGEILHESQWTHTAIKKLPEGLLDLQETFGRSAPLVLDLGCGNGRYLLSTAVWRPTHDHLGVDSLPVVIRYATRRANQRGLTNIRFAVIGGKELLERHIAPASVAEIHCYHPQPYYEPSEVHKRLVTPAFLALVHRALKPDGLFVLQTDNPGYWKYMKSVAPVFFHFEEQRTPWLEAPKGRTRREILALKRGLPVSRGVGRPRANLTEAEAIKLAETLPPPTFDADRRLHELDRLEREG